MKAVGPRAEPAAVIDSGSTAEAIRKAIYADPKFRLHLLLVLTGAFSLGCLVYLSVVTRGLFSFSPPPIDSDVVGWITLHQYPKQQEVFYYALGIAVVVVTAIASMCAWGAFSWYTAAAGRSPLQTVAKWSSVLYLPASWWLYHLVSHWPPPKETAMLRPALQLIVVLHAVAFATFNIGPSRLRSLFTGAGAVYTAAVAVAGAVWGLFLPFVLPERVASVLSDLWLAWPLLFIASWVSFADRLAQRSEQSMPQIASRLTAAYLPAAALTMYPFLLNRYAVRLVILFGSIALAAWSATVCMRRIERGSAAPLIGPTFLHGWLAAVLSMLAATVILAMNPYLVHGNTIGPLDGDYFTTWLYDGIHGKLAFRDGYYYPYGPLRYFQQILLAKWFGLDRSAFLDSVTDMAGNVALLYVIVRILMVNPFFALAGALLVIYHVPGLRVLIPLLGLMLFIHSLNRNNPRFMIGAGVSVAVSLLYSIEAALCVIVASALVFCTAYLQSASDVRRRLVAIAARFAGGLAVVLVPLVAIVSFAGLLPGIVHSAVTTLSTVNNCCGVPFPNLLALGPVSQGFFGFLGNATFQTFYLVPVVYAIACVVLAARFFTAWRLSESDLLLLGVVAFGVLLFRSALGRSDPGHAAFASLPAFLVAACLGERIWGNVARASRNILQRPPTDGAGQHRLYHAFEAVVMAAFGIALFALPGWPGTVAHRLTRDTKVIQTFHKLAEKTPPNFDPALTTIRTPDGDLFWFRNSGPTVNAVTNYLRSNLAPTDRFFCFPYVSRYYVLLGQTSLGTFGPAIWGAPAKSDDQQRLVEMLKAERPKYVIYDESEWPDSDGVPWMDRASLIFTYIFDNYSIETKIGNALILRAADTKGETPSRLMVGDFSQQRYLIRGWYYPATMGQLGRWTTTHAAAKIKCPAANASLYIRTSILSPSDRRLSIAIEGRSVLETSLAGLTGEQIFKAVVPSEFHGRDVRVDLRVSGPIPAADSRTLGLWVTEIGARAFTPPVSVGRNIKGRGSDGVLELEYRDPDGPEDVEWSQIIVNSLINGVNACYINYAASADTLALADDAGTSWSSPVTIGSPRTLENSQCVVDPRRSSAGRDGGRIKVRIAVHFKPAFTGRKQIYTLAHGKNGQMPEWTVVGAWEAAGR